MRKELVHHVIGRSGLKGIWVKAQRSWWWLYYRWRLPSRDMVDAQCLLVIVLCRLRMRWRGVELMCLIVVKRYGLW